METQRDGLTELGDGTRATPETIDFAETQPDAESPARPEGIGPAGPTRTAPMADANPGEATLERSIEAPGEDLSGRRLGAYEVRERIGQGGMGEVYLAVRVADYEQKVAIKVIRHGMASAPILRRFQTEVGVLAALGKHPNIAGLSDAGTSDDGRPYFVMEYVRGRRIDVDCDARKLDIDARLALFRKVCDAVHYAHQHAVIHRDLKPSNILVTSAGEPKLIDFGIAKLAGPESGAGAEALTGTGQLLLTPEYASPEQARGEPVTTASDVYSLGVILYELLTGRRPYRTDSRSVIEALRAVIEQEPERPSTVVVRSGDEGRSADRLGEVRDASPQRLARRLSGDLDNIVLMALRKEPGRRYASAEQLSEDIQRYFNGLPVVAHKDTIGYRARKFARRHRAAVAASALVVLSLTGGLVATSAAMVRARRERDRATHTLAYAREAVDGFLTEVSEHHLINKPGFDDLRRTLLMDARRYSERFLEDWGNDPSVRAEVAATTLRLARIDALIGSKTDALAGFRRAEAAWRGLIAAHPEAAEYREKLAVTLDDEGIELAKMVGRGDEALGVFREALGLQRRLVAEAPGSEERLKNLGSVLQDLGRVQEDRGDAAPARATYAEALNVRERLRREHPGNLGHVKGLAVTEVILGRQEFYAGHPEKALEHYGRSRDLFRQLVRERPDNSDDAYRLATVLGDMAIIPRQRGNAREAEVLVRESLDQAERIARNYPGVDAYQSLLALACEWLADLRRDAGDGSEAEALSRRGRDVGEALVARHPEVADYRNILSKSYNNLGRMLGRKGDRAEAVRSFERAADLLSGLRSLQVGDQYNLACNLALALPLIGDPSAGLTPEERDRREKTADRAMAALRASVRGGMINAEMIQGDKDLDPLRSRDDYQALVRGLAAPTDAKK